MSAWTANAVLADTLVPDSDLVRSFMMQPTQLTVHKTVLSPTTVASFYGGVTNANVYIANQSPFGLPDSRRTLRREAVA